MVIQLIEKLDLNDKTDVTDQQRLTLPSHYSWQQFLDLEMWLADAAGLRITYLDGNIELMTLGETHEGIKGVLRFLLEVYFVEKGIRFFPVGSATRRDETKDVSFEPDESYYLGEKKSYPDLAIEIIVTSGNMNKLEKYSRFAIPEVWFWQNNQLFLYHW
jgi:Uma2 family endonuclease